MKHLKSLTCLLALVLSACAGRSSSATFSSSSILEESSSSLEENSSSIAQSSSLESSSSNEAPSNSSSSLAPSSSSLPSSSANHSSNTAPSSSHSASSSSYNADFDYYHGYYSSLVSWQNGEDLMNQLHAIIRNGYTPLSYTKSSTQNYDTNINADHSKYDFEYLDILYSESDIFKTETNKGWQREHAWCASLMCGTTTGFAVQQKGRATDFHNLFAAEAGGNQSRGNKNYGVADKNSASYVNRLSDNDDGYSFDSIVFEPSNKDKGRLARAIFYMATMYKDDEKDTANNVNMKGLKIVDYNVDYVAGDNCQFAIGNLDSLLEWNNDYAVDYLEMQHNISVYSSTDNPDGVAQGNRNPFVDYPELVDYVYGSKRNDSGTLKSLRASAFDLNINDSSLSHYAIKEAQRNYVVGETLERSDYKVVAVNYDYTYSDASSGISNSYFNHTFTETEGNSVIAKITTPKNVINYQIHVNPMGSCSSGVIPVDKTGIDNKKPNVEQPVNYGGIDFYLMFETDYANVASDGVTLQNDNKKGGFTFGSTNKSITKLVITSKNEYYIDRALVKAISGNSSSFYRVTIKVGDTVLLGNAGIINDTEYRLYGGSVDEPVYGHLSYTFEGSTSIKVNSIAFNEIIV